MPESWSPIPGYEGRWEASTEGRIKSLPRRRTRGGVLKQRVNKRGYLTVSEYDKGRVDQRHDMTMALLEVLADHAEREAGR